MSQICSQHLPKAFWREGCRRGHFPTSIRLQLSESFSAYNMTDRSDSSVARRLGKRAKNSLYVRSVVVVATYLKRVLEKCLKRCGVLYDCFESIHTHLA